MNPILPGISQQTFAVSDHISYTAEATSGSAQSVPVDKLPSKSLNDSAWLLLRAFQNDNKIDVRIMGLSLDKAFEMNAMNLISEQPAGNVYRNDFQLYDGSPASVSIRARLDDSGRYDITGYGMNAPSIGIDIHEFPIVASEPKAGDPLSAPEAGRSDAQNQRLQARIERSVRDPEKRGVATEETINAFLRSDSGTPGKMAEMTSGLHASGLSANQLISGERKQATDADVNNLQRNNSGTIKTMAKIANELRAHGLNVNQNLRRQLHTEKRGVTTEEMINTFLHSDEGTLKTTGKVRSDLRASGHTIAQDSVNARNLQATSFGLKANVQPALVDSLLRQLIYPERRPTDSGKQMQARGEPSALTGERQSHTVEEAINMFLGSDDGTPRRMAEVVRGLRTSGLSANQLTSGERNHALQSDINSLLRNDDGTMKNMAQLTNDLRASGLNPNQNLFRQLTSGAGRTNAATSEKR